MLVLENIFEAEKHQQHSEFRQVVLIGVEIEK